MWFSPLFLLTCTSLEGIMSRLKGIGAAVALGIACVCFAQTTGGGPVEATIVWAEGFPKPGTAKAEVLAQGNVSLPPGFSSVDGKVKIIVQEKGGKRFSFTLSLDKGGNFNGGSAIPTLAGKTVLVQAVANVRHMKMDPYEIGTDQVKITLPQ
jgi:hypothetical protein